LVITFVNNGAYFSVKNGISGTDKRTEITIKLDQKDILYISKFLEKIFLLSSFINNGINLDMHRGLKKSNEFRHLNIKYENFKTLITMSKGIKGGKNTLYIKLQLDEGEVAYLSSALLKGYLNYIENL